MHKIVNFIDKTVRRFWIVLCIIIFAVALVIKAKYSFQDFPYFERNTIFDIIFLALFVILYMILYKNKGIIEKKIKYWMLWLFFGILGVLFVVLVPIKPFSDMQHVVNGALLFAKRDINGILNSEYLQNITKNMKVSGFYALFIAFFPKTHMSLKIVNVFFYLLIAHFMSLIAYNMNFKYSKMVYIFVASFLPLILYCNHVYYDLPTLLMCTIGVYFYTKGKDRKNMLLCGLCLGIGASLRILAYLFLIAIIVDYVFYYKKEIFNKHCNQLIILLCFVIISVGIPKICDLGVNTFFRVEGAQDESIWDLFWMGINEEEFGFKHNEIQDGTKKSFSDFYELLISRDVEQNCKLFGRKIFWEWSQGTYQAQRYAFGAEIFGKSNEEQLAKFQYVTPVTQFFLNDGQIVRRIINSLCRAQYLALFLFMIIGMFNMKDDEMDQYRMFIYLMFGTFLVLFFYELKSRYVLHCLIPMIVLALRGCERVSKRAVKRGWLKW